MEADRVVPPSVNAAVIWALPGAAAVTTPLLLTSAIVGALLENVAASAPGIGALL
jgi:hypothetical protein